MSALEEFKEFPPSGIDLDDILADGAVSENPSRSEYTFLIGYYAKGLYTMNEFDQFVKHRLKAKHYIRYADDEKDSCG